MKDRVVLFLLRIGARPYDKGFFFVVKALEFILSCDSSTPEEACRHVSHMLDVAPSTVKRDISALTQKCDIPNSMQDAADRYQLFLYWCAEEISKED